MEHTPTFYYRGEKNEQPKRIKNYFRGKLY